MSDDRSSVTENNEKKFKRKNREDNEDSWALIGSRVSEDDRPRDFCNSLEANNPNEIGFDNKKLVVANQGFCRFCRDIPDYLIDDNKRDSKLIKNFGYFDVQRFKLEKDDNPEAERNYRSTYFSEPIHHDRNIVGDRKCAKFILSEVIEDRKTRSKNNVNHEELLKCEGESDEERKNRIFTFSIEMNGKSSPKSFTNDAQRLVDEASSREIDKGQEENGSCDLPKDDISPKFRGSPELRRKFSRTDAVRDDARKLKSATLDRMGKIFKLKSNQASTKELHEEIGNSEAPKDSYVDQQSRKEKTNSLGRMFKLVDKNGEPRKLLPHSRTGSLSHILRRKSTGAEENDSSGNRNNRSVFSRLLSQWKNRSGGGNATAEPNLRASIAEEDKSSSTKPVTTSRTILSSACTNSLEAPASAAQISSFESNGDVENPA